MKNKTLRLCSLLLVLILTIGLIPMNASADIIYGSGDNSFTCTFTTFEDLKNLVETANPRITWATYTGTGPLVIESSLTLYPGLVIEGSSSRNELQIPAGVTFRTSEYLFFTNAVVDGTLYTTEFDVDNLTVNGTLHTESMNVYDSLRGTGTIKCSDTFNADFPSLDAFDLNKIDLRNASHANFAFPIRNAEELEALCAMAERDSRNIVMYGGTTQETLTFTKSYTIPENTTIAFMQPAAISRGCTLTFNGQGAAAAPLTVKGSLINNSTFLVVAQEDANGAIAFSNTGTYSGTGELAVYCESGDAISSVITGIDLSEFQITERNDEDWELGLIGQRWHLKYMGPGYVQPEPEPTDPNLPTITGSYTTDITMSAADLGVDAPDARLRATLTFTDDGKVATTWEAVDVTALQKFFHSMFVNSYYAMAYNAGITDINEIEAYCRASTGMSVSAYMDQFVPYDAIRLAFTPSATRGTYSYNADHTAILTNMAFMDVQSDPSVENSFVLADTTLYLTAASWGKPDFTFVCTAR